MKKARRLYDREFKISVVAELEAGKPLAHIACEYGVHQGRYMIIQETHSSCLQLFISQSCQAMDVRRRGCRKWRIDQNSDTSENTENKVLRDEIRDIALEIQYLSIFYQHISLEGIFIKII